MFTFISLFCLCVRFGEAVRAFLAVAAHVRARWRTSAWFMHGVNIPWFNSHTCHHVVVGLCDGGGCDDGGGGGDDETYDYETFDDSIVYIYIHILCHALFCFSLFVLVVAI